MSGATRGYPLRFPANCGEIPSLPVLIARQPTGFVAWGTVIAVMLLGEPVPFVAERRLMVAGPFKAR